jgi:hypothetical protein
MYVARPARGELPKVKGMQVITVSRVDELFRELFG